MTFQPCPTRAHAHEGPTFCGAVPDGRRFEPLHERCCTVDLRADKTHLGDHEDRKGRTWPNPAPRRVVPERMRPSR